MNHEMQEFIEQVDFPEMVFPEEDMKRLRGHYADPTEKIKLGKNATVAS